jgi:hypothetical protein
MGAAITHELPGALRIRVVTAPFFLATKIEAFRGRGKGDFAVSHDLEDLIFVIDGHASIADDVRSQSVPLREYLRAEFRDLLGASSFIDALPGYLMPDPASQARLDLVLRRMEALAT